MTNTGTRLTWRGGLAAAAALAVLAGAGNAAAQPVTKSGGLACDGFECADSWEVKCTQSSHKLCVTVENTSPNPDPGSPPSLFVSGVATTPTTLLGQAGFGIAATPGPDAEVCFLKSGNPAAIKGLVAITPTSGGIATYDITVTCTLFTAPPLFFELRKAAATAKQNE